MLRLMAGWEGLEAEEDWRVWMRGGVGLRSLAINFSNLRGDNWEVNGYVGGRIGLRKFWLSCGRAGRVEKCKRGVGSSVSESQRQYRKFRGLMYGLR